MTRNLLSVAAVLAVASASQAQYYNNGYVNPYTGGVVQMSGVQNPYTGGYTTAQQRFNPYTGNSLVGSTVYNPYTGLRYDSLRTYNPVFGYRTANVVTPTFRTFNPIGTPFNAYGYNPFPSSGYWNGLGYPRYGYWR